MSTRVPRCSGIGLGGLSLIVVLAGCTVGPDYVRPNIELPAAYPEIAVPDATATPNDLSALTTQWWTLYNDAALTDLVNATLTHNTDLVKASAQIEEAEAVLAETSSARLPEIDLGASSTRSKSSTLNAQPLFSGTPVISNSNRLALSASFELDFWGKIRRATEASRALLLSSHYAKQVTALTLAGTAVQSYFTLRALDAQIALTEQILNSRDEALSVVKSRARGGLASDLDISQAEGARADASIQLHELRRQRALIEHQLGLLTGNLALKIAADTHVTLPAPALPPVGLPSTLLEHRPDVQAAEQNLIAANADIGFARAAQFPTFSLTGSFGGQSQALSDITKAGARIWSLGLNATLPIIDAGKYSARTHQAEARQRQAEATYRKTVETAFKDVADALTNVEQTTAITTDLQTKADAARNALHLSRLRYEAGYSAYLEVLDAQRTANAAELSLVQNQQAQLAYSVDLIKALGGGWSASDGTDHKP